MILEVIVASLLGTAVKDVDTDYHYSWYNGRWTRFIDFGKPGALVSNELSLELNKAVKAYQDNEWNNRGKTQLA